MGGHLFNMCLTCPPHETKASSETRVHTHTPNWSCSERHEISFKLGLIDCIIEVGESGGAIMRE